MMMPDPVALTRKLVQFDTTNPPGNTSACAGFLANLLSDCGFDVVQHAYGTGRTNILAQAGPANPARRPLCFTGHLDTVPLGNMPWKRQPLSADIEGPLMYGRGTTDMKAGIAAFVSAAAAEMEHIRKECPVSFVITADEETGCQGAADLMRQKRVTPFSALIVAEPTSNMPWLGHKGALWLKARTEGVAAHGSMPERGVNAIYKAARAIARIEETVFSAMPHPVLGKPTINVGRISGGININSVPDSCEFSIDIRSVPGLLHQELVDQIGNKLGPDVALDTIIDVPSVWTSHEDPWIQSVSALVEEVLDRRIPISGAPYFTDAAILQDACPAAPILILGPGDAEMAHKTDEYCRVENIHTATDIYRRLIRLRSVL